MIASQAGLSTVRTTSLSDAPHDVQHSEVGADLIRPRRVLLVQTSHLARLAARDRIVVANRKRQARDRWSTESAGPSPNQQRLGAVEDVDDFLPRDSRIFAAGDAHHLRAPSDLDVVDHTAVSENERDGLAPM